MSPPFHDIYGDRFRATDVTETKGPELFGVFVFLLFVFFCGFPVVTIFIDICSILELEGAISTVFATCLSSNH